MRAQPMRPVHELMAQAVRRRYFPSAVLLVATDGQPVLYQAYGDCDLDTVFDLASLTKPLALGAVVMRLVAEGKLAYGARLASLVPELAGCEVGGVRVSQLLAHGSGLPAWRPYFERTSGIPVAKRRDAIRRWVAEEPLEHPPGSQAVYSDLGYILLDWAVERSAGARLHDLARRMVYEPLELSRTGFVDLLRPGARQALRQRPGWTFAATELLAGRRQRLVAEVHDDNCRAMGGVSGHAGLFSTAHDVHLLVRELVAAYHGGRSLFAPKVVRQAWRRSPVPGSSWALGWDTPSGETPSCGRYFGTGAVGHLGFTGTSVWLDPARRLWVILLTNRVYFGREPNPMRLFRPQLHDRVMRALMGRAV
ncbi:MAG: serine hydrolase [Deltaproteobacteria bacterium]|nr:serine hydrolase [Deltaproteobacteria bacterium]